MTGTQKLIAAALAAALAAGCGSSAGGGGPSAQPATTTTAPATTTAAADAPTTGPPSTAAEAVGAEPLPLAWQVVEVVDESRPTLEVASTAGEVRLAAADSRTLPTPVLYPGAEEGEDAEPADVEPRPLIVWLNGLGGLAEPSDPMLQAFSGAGYIVAAPNVPEIAHPASSAGAYDEQPADAIAVLDALLDPADGVADDLAGIIDPDRIAFAGHSLGTAGIFGATYQPCCSDDRIGAVVAFGANPAFTMGGEPYDFSGRPLLLVYGEGDEVSPPDLGREILAAAAPPVFMRLIEGADHFNVIYGGPAESDADALDESVLAAIVFLDRFIGGTVDDAEFTGYGEELGPESWLVGS